MIPDMFIGTQVVLKLSTVLAMPFRGSDEINAGFNGLKLLKTASVGLICFFQNTPREMFTLPIY